MPAAATSVAGAANPRKRPLEAVSRGEGKEELCEGVRGLVEMVCDTEMMQSQAVEMGCKPPRAFQDVLSRPALKEGLTWLRAIERELQKPTPGTAAIRTLSTSFYSATGAFGKAEEQPVLDSMLKLGEKLRVMEVLSDMECSYDRLVKLAAGGGYRKDLQLDPPDDETPAEDQDRADSLVMGAEVLLDGLKKAVELNGSTATLGRFDPENGRWQVLLPSGETRNVKPENLAAKAAKKPTSPFFLYLGENRERIARELGPTVRLPDISKWASEHWKNMQDEEKAPYEERHKALLATYRQEQSIVKAKEATAREAADPLVQRQLRLLGCNLEVIAKGSKVWTSIYEAVKTTRRLGLGDSVLRVSQIFSVSRPGEQARFARHAADPRRSLLWYGQPLASWATLLSQGLHPPPSEGPLGVAHFGKGLYLWDLASEAARRSLHPDRERGLLLLVEVAMGGFPELKVPDPRAERLQSAKNCGVIGLGALRPSRSELLPDGARLHLGPVAQVACSGPLPLNEYLVLSTARTRMRFIVEVYSTDSEGAAAADAKVAAAQASAEAAAAAAAEASAKPARRRLCCKTSCKTPS